MNTKNQNPKSYTTQPHKSRRTGCWIAAAIVGFLAISFFALIFLFMVVVGSSFSSKPPTIHANNVLELKLPGELQEEPGANPFSLLLQGQKSLTFSETISAIERAKEDDNIKGIYLNPMHFQADITKTIEIYHHLEALKQSGKFIYAFIEFGNEWDYFLSTAADSIFMPPEAIIEFNGFAVLDIFWKGTYQKLGIDYYVEQYEEYKAAAETVTRSGFSRPARESIRGLLNKRTKRFVTTVARARGLDEQNIQSALRRGIYRASDMWTCGLIDGILPLWKVKQKIQRDAQSKKLRLAPLSKYAMSKSGVQKEEYVKNTEIAVIVASGLMISGDTGDLAPFEESMCASKSFARHLNKARKDKNVKAIILRIDSPGGSIMAADEMWSEIDRTRRQKPVFASMSSVAASGGYYIATACDKIIAHPSTVTGSIGVVSMIPNFSGTLDKIDATVDTIKTTDSALFLNPFLPFQQKDKSYFSDMSKDAYYRFVEKVAESRRIGFQQARQLAKGRIWTGEQAYEKGLVDSLGTLQTAIDMIKNRLGIAETDRVRTRFFPQPKDNLSVLISLLSARIAGKNSSVHPTATSLLAKSLPGSAIQSVQYHARIHQLALDEHILMIIPSLLKIE